MMSPWSSHGCHLTDGNVVVLGAAWAHRKGQWPVAPLLSWSPPLKWKRAEQFQGLFPPNVSSFTITVLFFFLYSKTHRVVYRLIFGPKCPQVALTDPMAAIHVVCAAGARWVHLIGKCGSIRRKHQK